MCDDVYQITYLCNPPTRVVITFIVGGNLMKKYKGDFLLLWEQIFLKALKSVLS